MPPNVGYPPVAQGTNTAAASGPVAPANVQSQQPLLSGDVLEARFQALSPEEKALLTSVLTPEVGAIVKKLLDPSCSQCIDVGVNTPPITTAGANVATPPPINPATGPMTGSDMAVANSPLRRIGIAG